MCAQTECSAVVLCPVKHAWGGNFLWNMNFNVRSCDQSIARESNWPLDAVPPAPVRSCFSHVNPQKEASRLHFNSPTAPHTASASSGRLIPDDMLGFLGTFSEWPLSCNRRNSKGCWKVRHKVSKGRFSVNQPPFLQLLKSSVQE